MMFFKMLNQFRCSHDYKLYNVAVVQLGTNFSEYEYRFVCDKCKKQFSIKYHEIVDCLLECKENFNKLVATKDIDISKYKKISFCIKPFNDLTNCYEGEYVNWFIEKLNKRGLHVSQSSCGNYHIEGTLVSDMMTRIV